jgi:hypothetical protein
MAGTNKAAVKRPAAMLDVDEPDVELEVFEEPLDRLFPRIPNVVSRRGHRALKVNIRIKGRELIPANASAVKLEAEVITFGPERIGANRHVFRHRQTWGTKMEEIPLRSGHGPNYTFPIVILRSLGDDHLGQGPYDAVITITPIVEGLAKGRGKADRNMTRSVRPKVSIRFTAM